VHPAPDDQARSGGNSNGQTIASCGIIAIADVRNKAERAGPEFTAHGYRQQQPQRSHHPGRRPATAASRHNGDREATDKESNYSGKGKFNRHQRGRRHRQHLRD
jgi:hypothetical protein